MKSLIKKYNKWYYNTTQLNRLTRLYLVFAVCFVIGTFVWNYIIK